MVILGIAMNALTAYVLNAIKGKRWWPKVVLKSDGEPPGDFDVAAEFVKEVTGRNPKIPKKPRYYGGDANLSELNKLANSELIEYIAPNEPLKKN